MGFKKNLIELIFSASIASIYLYTLVRDTELFNGPHLRALGFPYVDSFGGRAKFLTFLNMVLQCVYFILSFFKSVSNVFSSGSAKLNILCDRMYNSLAFPFSLIVVATFWIVYAIDRKFIYPEILDSIIPSWINHVKHTLPLVACLLSNMIVEHHYPKFQKGVSITMFAGACYLIWIFYIGHMSNKWVYGFLGKMSYQQRAMFAAFQMITGILSYKTGEIVNNLLWGSKRINLKKIN